MPIYDYKCQVCGKIYTSFRTYEDRDQPILCCKDSTAGLAVRIFSVPMIQGDYQGYVSPATGKWVEGRKAHVEDLARSNCRLLEPGESREYIRSVPQKRQEAIEKAVEVAVEAAAKDLGMG